MIMAEKKIFSIEVAMDEPMFHAIKEIAEADGVTSPEMIRMLISTMIEDRRAYFARLESIFGQNNAKAKEMRTLDAQDFEPQ